MRSRPFLFIGIALAGGTLAGELLVGYGLWQIEHERSAIAQVVLDLRAEWAAARRGPPEGEWRTSYQPRAMFAPDAELGFAVLPGVHTVAITNTVTAERHVFRVTVDARGRRVTSPAPEAFAGKPEIWMLGDSFVFGWGNNDETTLGYFLQRYLPDRRVANFAGAGYGNLHGLIQLRREFAAGGPPPVTIVVGYAAFYNERNVASPNRLRAFRHSASGAGGAGWSTEEAVRFTHPRARLAGDRLVVDYVPLFTAEDRAEGHRRRREPEPPLESQYAVTRRVLGEILDLGRARGCRMILAFLEGNDADPVVAFAREAGYEVADLRPDYKKAEWDDFRPFDYHPGPRAQSVYAWKLFQALRSEVTARVDGADRSPGSQVGANAMLTTQEPSRRAPGPRRRKGRRRRRVALPAEGRFMGSLSLNVQ